MHREISRPNDLFDQPSPLGLYFLTGCIGLLISLDLFPEIFNWLNLQLNLELPRWDRSLYGIRYALMAAVLGGARVIQGCIDKLVEGRFSSELAIALACAAAIIMGEPLVAAEVVFISLLGECLEAWTFARTQTGIRKLVEVFPKRCWRIRDGQEERIFTIELQVGDIVQVKPGGKIPVDGTILTGESTVNVAALTGESLPIEKSPGDTVLAGTINLTSPLQIRADKVAESTIAGQVITLTARALQDKSKIQSEADRLAQWFLPVVLLLAFVAFLLNLLIQRYAFRPLEQPLGWGLAARTALYPTLSVLVVACPCALVLATPAAVIAALGRLAGTGVLIKGSSAIERLAQVQGFAFDKTGTLTEGNLQVTQIVPEADISENLLLQLAGQAEASSDHPIAKAIVRECQKRQLDLTTDSMVVTTIAGQGLVWTNAAGESFRLGKLAWLNRTTEAIADGFTAIGLERQGQFLGTLVLQDTPRPEVSDVLRVLKNQGAEQIAILSGDRQATVDRLRTDWPVDSAHGDLLPQQKAEWLQQQSTKFVFVGDGINDAPALATAHVGIAVGREGADVAAEAGDVILMGEPLEPLPLLIRLSRETVRVIRQNILWFAFGVNLVGVLIGGFLWPIFANEPGWFEKSPLFGAIYHQIGSLAVLLNSMRLLRFEKTIAVESTLGRWRERFFASEAWLDRNLRFDDWIHEIGHHFKKIAVAIVILFVAGTTFSGLTTIRAEEVGVVQRFGRIVGQLEPGLHLRWPWFVETVVRITPDRERTVEVGFRLETANAKELSQQNSTELTWASAHGEEIRRRADESVLLTGDGNLIELLASLRYRIAEPQQFLQASADMDSLLRNELEAILREWVSSKPFLELLTTERGTIQHLAYQRLQLRLKSRFPMGLGIQVLGVTVPDLHPPLEVVPSYHDVARAIQDRDRKVNQAEAEALRRRRRAQETALQLTREAQSNAQQKLSDATAEQRAFLSWVQYQHQLTETGKLQLQQRIVQAVRQGIPPIDACLRAKQEEGRLIQTAQQLTRFRLSWDVLTQLLKGRDKVWIDAANLPGKRQLLLLDPELFKLNILLPTTGKKDEEP